MVGGRVCTPQTQQTREVGGGEPDGPCAPVIAQRHARFYRSARVELRRVGRGWELHTHLPCALQKARGCKVGESCCWHAADETSTAVCEFYSNATADQGVVVHV